MDSVRNLRYNSLNWLKYPGKPGNGEGNQTWRLLPLLYKTMIVHDGLTTVYLYFAPVDNWF